MVGFEGDFKPAFKYIRYLYSTEKYRGNIVALKISWQYHRGKKIAKVNISLIRKYRNIYYNTK